MILRLFKISCLTALLFACQKEDTTPVSPFVGTWVAGAVALVLDGATYRISTAEVQKYAGRELLQFSSDSTFQKIVNEQASQFGFWKYTQTTKGMALTYKPSNRLDNYTVSQPVGDSLLLATQELDTVKPLNTDFQNEIVNKVYYLMLSNKQANKPKAWRRITIKQTYYKSNE
jgi:hypothetical protein